jgi:hypothetical protein
LAKVHPLVLRANLEDDKTYIDLLGLTKRVNDLLRERSARGREAPLIFVDAAEHPNAYQLKGRYRVQGDVLELTLVVVHEREAVATFTMEVSASDLEVVTETIVEKMEEGVKSHLEGAA